VCVCVCARALVAVSVLGFPSTILFLLLENELSCLWNYCCFECKELVLSTVQLRSSCRFLSCLVSIRLDSIRDACIVTVSFTACFLDQRIFFMKCLFCRIQSTTIHKIPFCFFCGMCNRIGLQNYFRSDKVDLDVVDVVVVVCVTFIRSFGSNQQTMQSSDNSQVAPS
jgi:hypothetical protein